MVRFIYILRRFRNGVRGWERAITVGVAVRVHDVETTRPSRVRCFVISKRVFRNVFSFFGIFERTRSAALIYARARDNNENIIIG